MTGFRLAGPGLSVYSSSRVLNEVDETAAVRARRLNRNLSFQMAQNIVSYRERSDPFCE